MSPVLDAVIIGGGPAGLTAALYLARFRREFRLVDSGASRAEWIPSSHNIPFFEAGIPGPEIIARARSNVAAYGVHPLRGKARSLLREDDLFAVRVEDETGEAHHLRARCILLATGSVDVEPDLPDLPDAVRRGLVRYCPICDGYEARGKRIAVISQDVRGLGEAAFIARTYSSDVTLLTLGHHLVLSTEERALAARHGIRIIEDPVTRMVLSDGRIAAVTSAGVDRRYDVLYSALGLQYRSELAIELGAEHMPSGALIVDEHCQTSVPRLFAAGDIVRGVDQIIVGMGHAAVAATRIHNTCETARRCDGNGGRIPGRCGGAKAGHWFAA